MEQVIEASLAAHIQVFEELRDPFFQSMIRLARCLTACLKRGNKVLVAGNGGSAADAQHFAAELVGRYVSERRPLGAIALTTDSSALTAISNDYGFEHIFSRQIEALEQPGDYLVVISTSGDSENIVRALETALKRGMEHAALLGKDGGRAAEISRLNLVVPSCYVPRIQEVHGWILHTLCEMIEEAL